MPAIPNLPNSFPHRTIPALAGRWVTAPKRDNPFFSVTSGHLRSRNHTDRLLHAHPWGGAANLLSGASRASSWLASACRP